jgi:hypothetical protein
MPLKPMPMLESVIGYGKPLESKLLFSNISPDDACRCSQKYYSCLYAMKQVLLRR